MIKKINKLKKNIKKLKKKHKLGFTLVELLAVITILGIIMIIATPSVLSTMEVAKKKTFINYIQKVFNKGQEQYMSDLNEGTIPIYNTTEYLYDIETDLGLDNTGNFKGLYEYAYCANNALDSCWSDGYNKDDRQLIVLYNDEFFYFGFLDSGIPKADDIMSLSSFPDEVSSILFNYSFKEFYAHNESLSWCSGEKYIINGGVDSTGKKYGILAHITPHIDKYNPDGTCNQNPEYFDF